jgi:hypothetical protein
MLTGCARKAYTGIAYILFFIKEQMKQEYITNLAEKGGSIQL